MTLKFDRQRLEVAYSLFLIVLIPACLVVSTLWLTSQVRANFDTELRRKANLANEIFNVSVQSAFAHNTTADAAKTVQAIINQTIPSAPEISRLTVSVPQASGFRIIASSDAGLTGGNDSSIQTKVAWAQNQSVASLVAAGEAGDRDWVVATPVATETGGELAVTSMRVSGAAADTAMNRILQRAIIVLGAMVAVIMLLLLHHFRFVQYAELFRKQKELAQMKDDFISIATHELKAPMTVIKGYLSMALELKLAKEARDMVKIAFEQTDRLGRLVTDLLDVSRLEQGRTKYNLSAVDLPRTIGPMMSTFEVKAQEKNLKLSYQPPPNLPFILADPDRVTEIFTNLIDNAIKYSRTGTVTVANQISPEAIITTVSDTGIGLTPEEQSRLFQRFYRAQNSDTANIPGTGLGLWIIKQYTEHMGGSITVQSQKGIGTSFIVALPRAARAPAPAAPPTPGPAAG
jgi:signal transduction histidine kinase